MDRYQYDFFISHTTRDMGRIIALELQHKLALFGLRAYVAHLENVRESDINFLERLMDDSRSFIAIVTNEYIEEMSKDVHASRNFICYEFEHAMRTHLRRNRGFFVFGFGDFSIHSLIKQIQATKLIKESSDIEGKQHLVAGDYICYRPIPQDKPLSEGIPQALRSLRSNNKTRQFFLPSSLDTSNDYGSQAIIYFESLPKVGDEINAALKKLRDQLVGLSAPPGLANKTAIKEFVELHLSKIICPQLDSAIDLVPHKYIYANSVGDNLYAQIMHQPEGANQWQKTLTALLEQLYEKSKIYIADHRLQGYIVGKTPDGDVVQPEEAANLKAVLDISLDCLNQASSGSLNIVALGAGTGKREAQLVRDMLGLAWQAYMHKNDDPFLEKLRGSVRYILTDISMPLVTHAYRNTKDIFEIRPEEAPNYILSKLKNLTEAEKCQRLSQFRELLAHIEITSCFANFAQIDKLQSDLRRRPNTRNLFLLLGNTLNVLTVQERKDFIENIKNVSEPGDYLVIEVDTKITKEAFQFAFYNTPLKKPELEKLLTSFLSLVEGVSPTLDKDELVHRLLINSNGHNLPSKHYELFYTYLYDSENSKTFWIPLSIVPIGYNEDEVSKDATVISSVFEKHVHEFLPSAHPLWHLENVVPLYHINDNGSKIAHTPTLGIFRRLPEQ